MASSNKFIPPRQLLISGTSPSVDPHVVPGTTSQETSALCTSAAAAAASAGRTPVRPPPTPTPRAEEKAREEEDDEPVKEFEEVLKNGNVVEKTELAGQMITDIEQLMKQMSHFLDSGLGSTAAGLVEPAGDLLLMAGEVMKSLKKPSAAASASAE